MTRRFRSVQHKNTQVGNNAEYKSKRQPAEQGLHVNWM